MSRFKSFLDMVEYVKGLEEDEQKEFTKVLDGIDNKVFFEVTSLEHGIAIVNKLTGDDIFVTNKQLPYLKKELEKQLFDDMDAESWFAFKEAVAKLLAED